MVERFQMVGTDEDPYVVPTTKGPWVRYSDYAELETENARLTKERDDLQNRHDSLEYALDGIKARSEALSRTGAVKVKALDEDDYEEITNAAGIAMRRASSGIRGQVITVQDSFDWWVMKETERRIRSALEPAATCNESLQVEPPAPEGQQPVADALELSGNTGELIDRMAEAIRGDTTSDDTPWATLSEDRKEGWRGDAERALAVFKEYLTARRPAPEGHHPDDIAVDRFAAAMKEKLARKREEGRGGWDDKEKCSGEYLSRLVREHVDKGDPVDVGNLAMMLHQRGERIATEGQQDDDRIRREMEEILRRQSERDIPFAPATRPTEQAVTEAARAVCDNAKLVDIGKNGAFNGLLHKDNPKPQ